LDEIAGTWDTADRKTKRVAELAGD
jgi:hypothetical protein